MIHHKHVGELTGPRDTLVMRGGQLERAITELGQKHRSFSEAAAADLATLDDDSDPTGLQRAALETVMRSSKLTHAKMAAAVCHGANALRAVVAKSEPPKASGS